MGRNEKAARERCARTSRRPRDRSTPSARDLVWLTKPGIVAMTLIACGWGMALAPQRPSIPTVAAVLVGTTLSVASANAFNMILERDTDRRMARTRDRPLAGRRLPARAALVLAVALGVASVLVMAWGTNAATAILSSVALVLYAFVYTPLKTRTALALPVGAVAGSVPPLLGWFGARGRLDATCAAVFAVVFFWQFPHFIAISVFRRVDYAKAGIKTVPVVYGDEAAVLWTLTTSVLLVGTTLALVPMGATGWPCAAIVAVPGFWLLASAARMRTAGMHAAAEGARAVFWATLAYLPILGLGTLLGALVK